MRSSKLENLTISEASRQIKTGELSPIELTQAFLERINKFEKELNAYITVLFDHAISSAEAAENALSSDQYLGPLHGVPIALKDIFATKDILTTSGSKIFSDHVPKYNATVVERLNSAGAVLLGKLNMLEFATGDINNPTYGATHNPWDLERTTGGSSSGSGAAVAASLCLGSLGTDTGGSVRIPSSLCGIVGIKPTYGRVSRFGVTPLSWSLDHVGPMTKTVVDTAIMLQVIAGSDPKDPTSLKKPVPNYLEALTGAIQGLKVGVPRKYFFEIIDKEVEGATNKAIEKLDSLGSEVTEVTIKNMRHVSSSYNIITSSEAASYHDRFFDIHSQDYDPRVITNRILPGRFIPAVHYLKAQRFRSIFTKGIEKLFKLVDVIVTPTTPIPAFNIEDNYVEIGTEKVNARNALAKLTRAFNLTGFPSVTVPCGFTSSGLPIGLQIIAKRFDEAMALRVAHTYEINTPWHKRKPKNYIL